MKWPPFFLDGELLHVNSVFQNLGGAEGRRFASSDLDRLAGAGVAARFGCFFLDRELADAGKNHFLATRQGVALGIAQSVNKRFRDVLRLLGALGESVDQFLLGAHAYSLKSLACHRAANSNEVGFRSGVSQEGKA